MFTSRRLGAVLALATFLAATVRVTTACCEPPDDTDADAPYRHVLTGDDAESAERLSRRIEKLYRDGNFADALAPVREMIELRTRRQGAGHWQTQDAKRLLATLERAAGLEADARAELKEAIELNERAMASFQQGRRAEADVLERRAAAIYERHLGARHHETASVLYGWAVMLGTAGRLADAQPLHEQSLAIFRQALGEEHPLTANGYRGLAIVLDRGAKYAEAEPLFRRALSIQGRVVGAQDPTTATTIDDLAQNLDHQGKYAEAKPWFRQALEIRRQALGAEHSDTASSYRWIGNTQQ